LFARVLVRLIRPDIGVLRPHLRVVRGIGNGLGEVARDPGDPLLGTDQLGRDIFELKESIPTSESIPSEVVESGRLRIEHRLPSRLLLPLKSALKRYF
jgi:hypothetical protein